MTKKILKNIWKIQKLFVYLQRIFNITLDTTELKMKSVREYPIYKNKVYMRYYKNNLIDGFLLKHSRGLFLSM